MTGGIKFRTSCIDKRCISEIYPWPKSIFIILTTTSPFTLHLLVVHGDICCIEVFGFLWKTGPEPLVREGEKSEGVMRRAEEGL